MLQKSFKRRYWFSDPPYKTLILFFTYNNLDILEVEGIQGVSKHVGKLKVWLILRKKGHINMDMLIEI